LKYGVRRKIAHHEPIGKRNGKIAGFSAKKISNQMIFRMGTAL
jgi:hypothetical protein